MNSAIPPKAASASRKRKNLLSLANENMHGTGEAHFLLLRVVWNGPYQ